MGLGGETALALMQKKMEYYLLIFFCTFAMVFFILPKKRFYTWDISNHREHLHLITAQPGGSYTSGSPELYSLSHWPLVWLVCGNNRSVWQGRIFPHSTAPFPL